MNRFVMCAIAVSLGLTSCGAGPNTKRLTGQIGSGSVEVPPNYRELVADYLKRSLVDPSSLRDAGISEPGDRRVGILHGFRRPAVCVRYDAKDRFGEYTGSGSTVYWFSGGQVAGARRRPAFCADASYAPFPEAEGRVVVAAPAARVEHAPPPRAAKPMAKRHATPVPTAKSAATNTGGAKPAAAKPTPKSEPAPAKPSSGKPAPEKRVEAEPADGGADRREFIDERRRTTWFRQR